MIIRLLLIILLWFSILGVEPVFGFEIKFLRKVELSQEKELIQTPEAFCVTEDGLVILPDFKAGNIKIFDQTGALVKILGRKGYGPNEFKYPYHCIYMKSKKQFAISDFGLRKILFYKKTGKLAYERFNEIFSLQMAFDTYFAEDKIYFSAHTKTRDGRNYEFYSLNRKNSKKEFYLPSYYKYDLNSNNEFNKRFFAQKSIRAIGTAGWFDISGNNCYYVWEGNLRIIRINLKSGDVVTFGDKTSNYTKPNANKSLLAAFKSGNGIAIEKERSKLCLVKDIISTSKFVLVIYGESKCQNDSNHWAQFYNLNGKFLEEIRIPVCPGKHIYFKKDSSNLYSVNSSYDDDGNQRFFLVVYSVH